MQEIFLEKFFPQKILIVNIFCQQICWNFEGFFSLGKSPFSSSDLQTKHCFGTGYESHRQTLNAKYDTMELGGHYNKNGYQWHAISYKGCCKYFYQHFLCTILRWCWHLIISIFREILIKIFILVTYISAFKISIPSYISTFKILILVFFIYQ